MRGPVDYVFDGILSKSQWFVEGWQMTRRNTPQVRTFGCRLNIGNPKFYASRRGLLAVGCLFSIHVR